MGDAAGKRSEMTVGEDLPVYGLYGMRLASDFPFSGLKPEAGEPHLTFRLADAPPVAARPEGASDFASSPELDGAEESLVRVYRRDGYDVLRLTDVADFYMWPDAIVCHLLDPTYDYLVEIYLLGVVFSLWMELRGIPALHASAVVVEGRTVAFLATNKGGKSSLSAVLMQEGHPLLTDDILAVERGEGSFAGLPGYPAMRMWPDQALHFLGRYEELEIVHPAYSKRRVPVGEGGFGAFHEGPAPLACFYLPERRDPAERGTGTEITAVERAEALMTLVGQSFVPHTVEGLGLQPRRLGFFAPLVAQIPMRRISYPEGYEHISGVRREILADLANLAEEDER